MADAADGAEPPRPRALDPASTEPPAGVAHRSEVRRRPVTMVIAPAAVAVPATLLATATAFDIQSQRTGDQLLFAVVGFHLTTAGVLAGVAATVAVAWRLGRIEKGTAAFRRGRAALALIDAALIWFGVSWLRRIGITSDPVPAWALALSGLAVVGLATAVTLLVLATLELAIRIRVAVEVRPDT